MDLGDTSTKSTRLKEVDIPQNLGLLDKWTISKFDIKTIYDYGCFDKISHKQLIKTTEQSLALNSSEQTIRLLNKHDFDLYKSQYKFLHIGMVQIAFKPLTLKELPETFLAALRDVRNLNFRQSLMGSIESTMTYGPTYFNTKPNLQLSLTDSNILDALTLNVKTHGYNYAHGSELICLSYGIYFKLLATLNPRCKLYDRLKKDHKSPWTNNLTILMIKIKCFVCRMDPHWVTKGRDRGNNSRGRGRSSPGFSSGSSYGSSSNSPILQCRGMSLINLHSRGAQKATSLSIHLEDIPEGSPLYAELRAYLSQKEKGDTFASIAKDDVDDIKLYEKIKTLLKFPYKFLHIGMVQIAFKPMTLKGLFETFLAVLRDARNLNFRQSLMGSIESTVAYGPVYFNTQPNLQLSFY
ncbi:hypothetical protein MTR67_034842 [Solanum verrucosum]|uniref:Uncharacterized protein n=1 Tax=Solanum verrucosum TaxID=315347 RepID=A0AAF0U8W0_SOLVR|nr:hypothetical protein MTR67_034842 [Solanum verrucosum]